MLPRLLTFAMPRCHAVGIVTLDVFTMQALLTMRALQVVATGRSWLASDVVVAQHAFSQLLTVPWRSLAESRLYAGVIRTGRVTTMDCVEANQARGVSGRRVISLLLLV